MTTSPATRKAESSPTIQGRIQDFKLGGGAYLKKLRRAEGGAKIVWVFRVRIRDFTPKKQITESLSYP